MSLAHLRAAIFDVDGTLLDTREFILAAFEHTLAEFGITAPARNTLRIMIGPPLKSIYAQIAPSIEFDNLARAHHSFQLKNFALILPYPGAQELLQYLKSREIKVGFCSTRAVTLIPSLEYSGLMNMADAVVDGGHVTTHKPDPESVHLTLSQLGIAADDTCMIGDSAVDIGAGINAGCAATIGVTHGFGTENSLREAGATYVVPSLGKIQTLF